MQNTYYEYALKSMWKYKSEVNYKNTANIYWAYKHKNNKIAKKVKWTEQI